MNNVSAKKTLYLHIGAPKTATSAIQRALYKNRANLLKKNYYYPSVDFENSADLQPIRVLAQGHGEHVRSIISDNTDKLVDELTEFKHQKLILSCEGLFLDIRDVESTADEIIVEKNQQHEKIKEFFLHRNYEIKVIVYFRNEVDFIKSVYYQLSKTEVNIAKLSIEDYIDSTHAWKYDLFVESLNECFGFANVLVGNFDEIKNDIINDFFLKADVNVKDVVIDDKKINVSSSMLAIYFSRKYLPVLSNRREKAQFQS